MVDPQTRQFFDAILDREVAALPGHVASVLDEIPLVVEDEPSDGLLASMGMAGDADLCGLHEGVPITERGVEDTGMMPSQMMLFRGPIVRLAGYRLVAGQPINQAELVRQVRITLLHEIGHHFGLDEDDLDRLGYA
ncbi:MAG: metallopeptidase family protein [Planctomycetota bacterium]